MDKLEDINHSHCEIFPNADDSPASSSNQVSQKLYDDYEISILYIGSSNYYILSNTS